MTRAATAHHEAGHFVIGELLDIGAHDSVTIEPEENDHGTQLGAVSGLFDAHVSVEGAGTWRDPVVERHDPSKTRDAVISLYAGAAAQLRFGDDHGQVRDGSGSDDDQATALLHSIGAEHDEQALRARAEQLVREQWLPIVAVAEELLRFGRLDAHHAGLASAVGAGDPDAEVYRAVLEQRRREREES